MPRRKNLATLLQERKQDYESSVNEVKADYRAHTLAALSRITHAVYERDNLEDVQKYDAFISKLQRSESDGSLYGKLEGLTQYLSEEESAKSAKKPKSKKSKTTGKTKKQTQAKKVNMDDLRSNNYPINDREEFISKLKDEYGLEGRQAHSYWMNFKRFSSDRKEPQGDKGNSVKISRNELVGKNYSFNNREDFVERVISEYGITKRQAQGYWMGFRGKSSTVKKKVKKSSKKTRPKKKGKINISRKKAKKRN